MWRLLLIILFCSMTMVSYAKQTVKVLIVTTFRSPPPAEAGPWLRSGMFTEKIPVAGVKHGVIYCNKKGEVCLMISGMGKTNMTASMMAVGLNPRFDLSKTFIILSGIAGGNPNKISLGSAAWAGWAVDGGLATAIDAQEKPSSWKFPYSRQGCLKNWCDKPLWSIGKKVYQLNPKLVNKAYQLTKNIRLHDSKQAIEYRNKYSSKIASAAPRVMQCDVIATDVFWMGDKLNEWATWWVKKSTQNKGTFCTSALEDTAFLTAIDRLNKAGLVNKNRVLILRAVSDYTVAYSKNEILDLIKNMPGLNTATINAYRVSLVVTKDIVTHWQAWDKHSQ